MSKVSKICGVDAEAIAALLSLEIGELREKLSYVDGYKDLSDWLDDGFEYDMDDYEVDEDDIELYDEDEDEDEDDGYWDSDDDDEDDTPYDDDCDDDDDDYGDDEVDTPSLTDEERELADAIIDDIDNGRYTIATIKGVYPSQVVDYVASYVD